MQAPERISRYCRYIGVDFDEAGFSMRTINCLRNVGLQSWRELTGKTEAELFAISNFGKVSMREVKEWLASQGMALKEGEVEPLEARVQRALGKVQALRYALQQAEAELKQLVQPLAA